MNTPHDEILQDEPVIPPITSSKVVYEGAVWDIRKETFDLPEATGLVRDLMAHTGAVGIAVVDDQKRILLAQQYRHPVRARLWEVPAGLLDIPGEDPLVAAQRELAEEADVTAAHWKHLVSSWTTPGGNDEMIHIYLATGISASEAAHAREDEEADIRVEWVPLSDAADAVLAGRMHNGILSIGVLAAAQKRRERR